MDEPVQDRSAQRRQVPWSVVAVAVLVLMLAGGLLWIYRDMLRPPQALYRRAQRAEPWRAAELYDALERRMPEIEEYARLWKAELHMPDLDALQTLRAVADFRPDTPAAYRAHVTLARYYAKIESSRAEDQYRAALSVYDPVDLRLELARYLEERGDNAAAYQEYRGVLGRRPDAFAGMRRTGSSPVDVARDLNAAYYFSDAVEVLRNVEDPSAVPLRARALEGLGRYEEARAVYEAWLESAPEDEEAREGLIEVLRTLGLADEVEALQEGGDVDTAPGSPVDDDEENPAGSGSNPGSDHEDQVPEDPTDRYLDSSDPLDWWRATTLLENQGRVTETLPIYARVARTDTYVADDAAYRLYVLAERLGDQEAKTEAETLLQERDLSWLALRALDEELRLPLALPLAPAGEQIIHKAEALESIGRPDLGRLELLLAAHSHTAPEMDLAVAQALAARNYVLDAQPIAEAYIQEEERAPRSFWILSYPRPYSSTVNSAAAEYHVDPHLIWSVMRQESRYDPTAFGYVAERGLMQILPATQDWIAEQLGEQISPGDAFTPRANVRMGAWYLRHLLDYYDGDLTLAVTAYNGGPGNVDGWRHDPLVTTEADFVRWIGFGQTREYLQNVLLNYHVYGALYGDAATAE